MCLALREALRLLTFILVKSQLRCYHLHFTHRKMGLREPKGLLGHVALKGGRFRSKPHSARLGGCALSGMSRCSGGSPQVS